MISTDNANARLLSVTTEGSSDTYETGGQGGPGPAKWTGDAGATYDERRERRTVQGGSDIFIHRTLTVRQELAIVWTVGDYVTFRRLALAAPATETGKVQDLQREDLPPGAGGHVTLTLELV